ncbi:MAG: DNRLRE domain-containing protein [Deltaproteobacteria bacterium]
MTEIYFTPNIDAYIAQWYPASNFGIVPYLYIGRYKQNGDVYRSLLEFNLGNVGSNAILPGSVIKNAYLNLRIYRNEILNGSTININAYRVLQNWSETGVTWNNQPICSSTPDGAALISSGVSGIIKIDLSSLIQEWFQGETVNRGIIIRGDEGANSLVGFFAREYPNTSFWPQLEVIY